MTTVFVISGRMAIQPVQFTLFSRLSTSEGSRRRICSRLCLGFTFSRIVGGELGRA